MKTNPALPTAGKRTLRSHQQVVRRAALIACLLMFPALWVCGHLAHFATAGAEEKITWKDWLSEWRDAWKRVGTPNRSA